MSALLSSLSGHFLVSCVLFCVLLSSSHAWKQWSNTEVVPSDIDGTVVPTYHFDMIRDTARNTAFYKALKQVIRPNVSNVLDLGSGSGLLAMMAVQAGARSVTAIERNDALYDLSTRIFKKNQMTSRIDVLHGESFDLVPEDIDAKNLPIHVLVAEVLDSWIIGEGFVSSLADLKMRHIIDENTIILPSKGKLYMQLVQTKYGFGKDGRLSNSHRLEAHEFDDMYNFDFSEAIQHRTMAELIVKSNDAVVTNLTEPIKVFDFDFQGMKAAVPESYSFDYPYADGLFDYNVFDLEILEDGIVHGGVFWFNVSVDPADTIHISCAPGENEHPHWLQMLKMFVSDTVVHKGDHIRFEIARMPERYMFTDVRFPEHRLLGIVSECARPIEIYASSAPDEDGMTTLDETPDYSVFSLPDLGSFNIMLFAVPGQIVRAVIEPDERQLQSLKSRTRSKANMGMVDLKERVEYVVETDAERIDSCTERYVGDRELCERVPMIRMFYVPC